MEFYAVLLLVGAGLAAGFIAGLVGVGGGVIFAPVLFFYFTHIGVSPDVVAQLTLGSSLFCTLIAAMTGARVHYRSRAVDLQIALAVGLFSALAVILMTRFVTTRPWYDGTVFQVVFSIVLLAVMIRMLIAREDPHAPASPSAVTWPRLFAMGSLAGSVSAAAGVGGGVVLVPAYHNLLRLPITRAVGTSSATIILISLAGVINYGSFGWHADTPAWAIGYVDVGHSAVLAGASIVSAQIGARVAHRVPSRVLRYSFAAIALIVAARLLIGALS